MTEAGELLLSINDKLEKLLAIQTYMAELTYGIDIAFEQHGLGSMYGTCKVIATLKTEDNKLISTEELENLRRTNPSQYSFYIRNGRLPSETEITQYCLPSNRERGSHDPFQFQIPPMPIQV